MPGSTKRTRTSSQEENDAPPTPPSSSTRPTRRAPGPAPAHAQTTPTPTTTTPPTPPATATPSRPIQTRSSTLNLAPPTPLTRTSSLFSPITRRADGNGSLPSSSRLPPTSMAGPSTPTRGGTLVRTQSTPVLSNPANLKAGITGGSGGHRGKGDPEDVFGLGGSGRRFGKGKENVPPQKDAENDEAETSRKRLRVGSRASGSGRGRSGSVASVRSESSNGPALFRRASAVFPSPSPSPSTAPSHSADSASTVDPFDLLTPDEMDVDRTPTKTRPIARRGVTMPTPPSSSPVNQTDVELTGKRIALFRMDSTVSIASTVTEVDAEVMEDSTPIKAKNAYKHLKSFLRLSSTTSIFTADEVIGREDEKAVLRSYFSLRSASDVGLYVSGPPGTGKTALVTAIGREMEGEGWKVVEVGCMGVKTSDVWTRLGQQLGCERTEEGVQQAIAQVGQNTLIILDEVDSLLPAAPAMPPPATSHLLSRLFSLPTLSRPENTVKFIAISNTLDLTVRARLVLADGAQPQVLPFKAYGTTEMIDIINSRIAAAACDRIDTQTVKVDTKAVELLTRKVEAQNGDLRMCLASLSSAVHLAEMEWVKKTFTSESDLALSDAPSVPLVKIALPHVIKAFNSHTQQLKAAAGSVSTTSGSPTSRKIRSVPLQGKMVLVSILIYLSRVRVGLPGCPSASSNGPSPTTSPHRHGDLTTSTLYATYSHLLSHASSPFPPAAESDYRDLLSNLETLGLVHLHGQGGSSGMTRSSSSSSRGKNGAAGGPKVELCVPEVDVKYGLGVEEKGEKGGVADEEVKKVWEREDARIGKTREKLARAVEALAGAEN